MSSSSLTAVARHIQRMATSPDGGEVTDAQLLARFRTARDESAFGTLVGRHGRMVMDICRRVLGHYQDAEDAFQATFLILARDAGSVRDSAALPCWLHGVARRVAGNVRRAATRRLARERRAPQPAPTQIDLELAWRELQEVLAQEVQRLPPKYQAPFVLCCLEGRSKAEAAAQLGWKEGTVSSRLAEARKRMQQRLARRGLTLATALCTFELSANAAPALPPTLVDATVRAAGDALAGGVPESVTALAEGLSPAAFAGRVKGAALLLAAAFLAAAAGFRMVQGFASPPADAQPAGSTVKSGDLDEALPDGAVRRLGTARLRPGGLVGCVAFSPDGKKLVSWSREAGVTNCLSVWDVRTGRLLRRTDLPNAQVSTLNWRADGRALTVLPAGGPDILVWELADEKAAPKSLAPASAKGAADEEAAPCYALSPDGKTLAVGHSGVEGTSGPIRLRPLQSDGGLDPPALRLLAREAGNLEILLFTPDGKRVVAVHKAKMLAAGGQENEQPVVILDAATGEECARFTAPRPAKNFPRPAVAVSNVALAIALDEGGTSVWDLATGKEKRFATDQGTNRATNGYGTLAVAFSHDGKTLVTGGRHDVVEQWDVATGEHLRTMRRHYSWIEALATSPDGRLIASAGQDGVIRLWDAATGADACPVPGHTYAVGSAVLSPDGRTAVTAGWDGTLRWWDTSTGRELHKVDLPFGGRALTLSPDGRTVIATPSDDRAQAWDLATGREISLPALPPGTKVCGLTFSPDGRQLVAGYESPVAVLDWPGMKVRHTLELPKPAKKPGKTRCESVAVSPDGRWLVTVARRMWVIEKDGLRNGFMADGVLDLWDLAAGRRVRRLAETGSTFNSAMFTAEGQVVLVGNAGTVPAQGGRGAEEFPGEVALIDPVAARLVRAFGSPTNPGTGFRYVGSTVLSPDGRTLYVSCNNREIAAFELATGQRRRTLTGHRGYIGALALSRDGRRLLSGGLDGTALLWDVTLAGAASRKKGPVTPADADALWASLARFDAAQAYAAMAELARAPERSVPLLRRHLRPASAAPSEAQLDRVFENLDSGVFATREQASRELAALGEPAVPFVRKRLEKADSAEVRRRALEFLDRYDPVELSPDRLRQLRAVEVLEGIGTPSAREVLAEWAGGAAGAPLTLEAAAARKRLERP